MASRDFHALVLNFLTTKDRAIEDQCRDRIIHLSNQFDNPGLILHKYLSSVIVLPPRELVLGLCEFAGGQSNYWDLLGLIARMAWHSINGRAVVESGLPCLMLNFLINNRGEAEKLVASSDRSLVIDVTRRFTDIICALCSKPASYAARKLIQSKLLKRLWDTMLLEGVAFEIMHSIVTAGRPNMQPELLRYFLSENLISGMFTAMLYRFQPKKLDLFLLILRRSSETSSLLLDQYTERQGILSMKTMLLSLAIDLYRGVIRSGVVEASHAIAHTVEGSYLNSTLELLIAQACWRGTHAPTSVVSDGIDFDSASDVNHCEFGVRDVELKVDLCFIGLDNAWTEWECEPRLDVRVRSLSSLLLSGKAPFEMNVEWDESGSIKAKAGAGGGHMPTPAIARLLGRRIVDPSVISLLSWLFLEMQCFVEKAYSEKEIASDKSSGSVEAPGSGSPKFVAKSVFEECPLSDVGPVCEPGSETSSAEDNTTAHAITVWSWVQRLLLRKLQRLCISDPGNFELLQRYVMLPSLLEKIDLMEFRVQVELSRLLLLFAKATASPFDSFVFEAERSDEELEETTSRNVDSYQADVDLLAAEFIATAHAFKSAKEETTLRLLLRVATVSIEINPNFRNLLLNSSVIEAISVLVCDKAASLNSCIGPDFDYGGDEKCPKSNGFVNRKVVQRANGDWCFVAVENQVVTDSTVDLNISTHLVHEPAIQFPFKGIPSLNVKDGNRSRLALVGDGTAAVQLPDDIMWQFILQTSTSNIKCSGRVQGLVVSTQCLSDVISTLILLTSRCPHIAAAIADPAVMSAVGTLINNEDTKEIAILLLLSIVRETSSYLEVCTPVSADVSSNVQGDDLNHGDSSGAFSGGRSRSPGLSTVPLVSPGSESAGTASSSSTSGVASPIYSPSGSNGTFPMRMSAAGTTAPVCSLSDFDAAVRSVDAALISRALELSIQSLLRETCTLLVAVVEYSQAASAYVAPSQQETSAPRQGPPAFSGAAAVCGHLLELLQVLLAIVTKSPVRLASCTDHVGRICASFGMGVRITKSAFRRVGGFTVCMGLLAIVSRLSSLESDPLVIVEELSAIQRGVLVLLGATFQGSPSNQQFFRQEVGYAALCAGLRGGLDSFVKDRGAVARGCPSANAFIAVLVLLCELAEGVPQFDQKQAFPPRLKSCNFDFSRLSSAHCLILSDQKCGAEIDFNISLGAPSFPTFAVPEAMCVAIELIARFSFPEIEGPVLFLMNRLSDLSDASLHPGNLKALLRAGMIDTILRCFGRPLELSSAVIHESVSLCHVLITNSHHSLRKPLIRLLLTLGSYRITPCELRRWLRLLLRYEFPVALTEALVELFGRGQLYYTSVVASRACGSGIPREDSSTVRPSSDVLRLERDLGNVFGSIPSVRMESIVDRMACSCIFVPSLTSNSGPAVADATKAQVFPPIAGFTFSTWLCFDKMGVYCVADANSLASRHRDYDSCYKSGRCIMCGGVINVMKELPCGHVGCARCVKERQKAGGRCVTCFPTPVFLYRFCDSSGRAVSEAYVVGRVLHVSSVLDGVKVEVVFSSFRFQLKRWYHVLLSYSRPKKRESVVSLFLDGLLFESHPLRYPSTVLLSEANCVIGTPPSYRHPSSLAWSLGPCMLISKALDDEGANALFCAGASYDGVLSGDNGLGELRVSQNLFQLENVLQNSKARTNITPRGVGRVGLDALAGVGRRASRSRKHLETSTETTLLSKLQLPAVGHSIIFSFSARRSETQSGQIQAGEIILGPRSAHAPYFQDIEASYSCNFMTEDSRRVLHPEPAIESIESTSELKKCHYKWGFECHIQSPETSVQLLSAVPSSCGFVVGQLIGGAKISLPERFADTLQSICDGGISILLLLMSRATTREAFFQTVLLLAAALRANKPNQLVMEKKYGYDIVSAILKQKARADLVAPETLRVLALMASASLDDGAALGRMGLADVEDAFLLGGGGAPLSNPHVFVQWLLDFNIWRFSSPSLQLFRLNLIRGVIVLSGKLSVSPSRCWEHALLSRGLVEHDIEAAVVLVRQAVLNRQVRGMHVLHHMMYSLVLFRDADIISATLELIERLSGNSFDSPSYPLSPSLSLYEKAAAIVDDDAKSNSLGGGHVALASVILGCSPFQTFLEEIEDLRALANFLSSLLAPNSFGLAPPTRSADVQRLTTMVSLLGIVLKTCIRCTMRLNELSALMPLVSSTGVTKKKGAGVESVYIDISLLTKSLCEVFSFRWATQFLYTFAFGTDGASPTIADIRPQNRSSASAMLVVLRIINTVAMLPPMLSSLRSEEFCLALPSLVPTMLFYHRSSRTTDLSNGAVTYLDQFYFILFRILMGVDCEFDCSKLTFDLATLIKAFHGSLAVERISCPCLLSCIFSVMRRAVVEAALERLRASARRNQATGSSGSDHPDTRERVSLKIAGGRILSAATSSTAVKIWEEVQRINSTCLHFILYLLDHCHAFRCEIFSSDESICAALRSCSELLFYAEWSFGAVGHKSRKDETAAASTGSSKVRFKNPIKLNVGEVGAEAPSIPDYSVPSDKCDTLNSLLPPAVVVPPLPAAASGNNRRSSLFDMVTGVTRGVGKMLGSGQTAQTPSPSFAPPTWSAESSTTRHDKDNAARYSMLPPYEQPDAVSKRSYSHEYCVTATLCLDIQVKILHSLILRDGASGLGAGESSDPNRTLSTGVPPGNGRLISLSCALDAALDGIPPDLSGVVGQVLRSKVPLTSAVSAGDAPPPSDLDTPTIASRSSVTISNVEQVVGIGDGIGVHPSVYAVYDTIASGDQGSHSLSAHVRFQSELLSRVLRSVQNEISLSPNQAVLRGLDTSYAASSLSGVFDFSRRLGGHLWYLCTFSLDRIKMWQATGKDTNLSWIFDVIGRFSCGENVDGSSLTFDGSESGNVAFVDGTLLVLRLLLTIFVAAPNLLLRCKDQYRGKSSIRSSLMTGFGIFRGSEGDVRPVVSAADVVLKRKKLRQKISNSITSTRSPGVELLFAGLQSVLRELVLFIFSLPKQPCYDACLTLFRRYPELILGGCYLSQTSATNSAPGAVEAAPESDMEIEYVMCCIYHIYHMLFHDNRDKNAVEATASALWRTVLVGQRPIVKSIMQVSVRVSANIQMPMAVLPVVPSQSIGARAEFALLGKPKVSVTTTANFTSDSVAPLSTNGRDTSSAFTAGALVSEAQPIYETLSLLEDGFDILLQSAVDSSSSDVTPERAAFMRFHAWIGTSCNEDARMQFEQRLASHWSAYYGTVVESVNELWTRWELLWLSLRSSREERDLKIRAEVAKVAVNSSKAMDSLIVNELGRQSRWRQDRIVRAAFGRRTLAEMVNQVCSQGSLGFALPPCGAGLPISPSFTPWCVTLDQRGSIVTRGRLGMFAGLGSCEDSKRGTGRGPGGVVVACSECGSSCGGRCDGVFYLVRGQWRLDEHEVSDRMRRKVLFIPDCQMEGMSDCDSERREADEADDWIGDYGGALASSGQAVEFGANSTSEEQRSDIGCELNSGEYFVATDYCQRQCEEQEVKYESSEEIKFVTNDEAPDEDGESDSISKHRDWSTNLPFDMGSRVIDVRLRPLLLPGDDIRQMLPCARIMGMDWCPALLLLCHEHVYIVDNFSLASSVNPGGGTSLEVVEATRPLGDSGGGAVFLDHGVDAVTPSALDSGNRQLVPHFVRYWRYENLRELHRRRYLLQHVGIEIFPASGSFSPVLVVFTTTAKRETAFKCLEKACPSVYISSTVVENNDGGSFTVRFKRNVEKSMTARWQNYEISTFQYLMYLNTTAGRSYNDITQYPVFPWILADYSSEELDLNFELSFRDLSKPMGALYREAEFRDRYEALMSSGGSAPPFHYGTHYSSAATVSNYLIRVAPFTDCARALQAQSDGGGHGGVDHADRIFASIRDSWGMSSGHGQGTTFTTQDVKELVPEFFYLPELFLNMNRVNLGVLEHSGLPLGVANLPPWAKGSPREFIRLHRAALESDYVSSRLHQWIDLIFGYKQQGREAEEACNVFYYLTYEESAAQLDLQNMADALQKKAIIEQIHEFGQTPAQLFRQPHPARAARHGGDWLRKNGKNSGSIFENSSILFASEVRPSFSGLSYCANAIGSIHSVIGERMIIFPPVSAVLPSPSITSISRSYHYFVAGAAGDALQYCSMGVTDSANSESKVLCAFDAIGNYISCICVTEDGRLLVVGSSCAPVVSLFAVIRSTTASGGSAATPPLRLSLDATLCAPFHRGSITAVAVSERHGVLVSACSQAQAVALWDLHRRVLLCRLPLPAAGCRLEPAPRWEESIVGEGGLENFSSEEHFRPDPGGVKDAGRIVGAVGPLRTLAVHAVTGDVVLSCGVWLCVYESTGRLKVWQDCARACIEEAQSRIMTAKGAVTQAALSSARATSAAEAARLAAKKAEVDAHVAELAVGRAQKLSSGLAQTLVVASSAASAAASSLCLANALTSTAAAAAAAEAAAVDNFTEARYALASLRESMRNGGAEITAVGFSFKPEWEEGCCYITGHADGALRYWALNFSRGFDPVIGFSSLDCVAGVPNMKLSPSIALNGDHLSISKIISTYCSPLSSPGEGTRAVFLESNEECVWRLKLQTVAQVHKSPITTLCVASDERRLFSGDTSGRVVSWGLPQAD